MNRNPEKLLKSYKINWIKYLDIYIHKIKKSDDDLNKIGLYWDIEYNFFPNLSLFAKQTDFN